VKQNGYNLTLGGGGSNLSPEAKETNIKYWEEYYKNREKREEHSLKRGSEPFNVYKNNTDELIGTWFNMQLCAKELNINAMTIQSCLTNHTNINEDYIFIYQHEDNCINRKRKSGYPSNKSYKNFNVYNQFGEFVMVGLDNLKCDRDLGLSSGTVNDCLRKKRFSGGGYIFLYEEDDCESIRNFLLSKMKNKYKSFNVYTVSGDFIKTYDNKSECARELNLCDGHINDCLQYKRNLHRGYKFHYVDRDPNLTNNNITKEAFHA
jgi:hypothetical protein